MAGSGRPTPLRIVSGGVFTGAGVSAMHYTGMAAIRIAGSLTYDATWSSRPSWSRSLRRSWRIDLGPMPECPFDRVRQVAQLRVVPQ